MTISRKLTPAMAVARANANVLTDAAWREHTRVFPSSGRLPLAKQLIRNLELLGFTVVPKRITKVRRVRKAAR